MTIQISSTEQFKSKSSARAPAENKYTTRATLTASGTKMNNSHGLRNNLLYESQDKCGNVSTFYIVNGNLYARVLCLAVLTYMRVYMYRKKYVYFTGRKQLPGLSLWTNGK